MAAAPPRDFRDSRPVRARDQEPSPRFVRDRFTWLAYLMLAYFAYVQAALGPLMPFLRDELGLSYTVGGLHLSAFALGMVLAGFVGARLVRRWGRRCIFWASGGGMAVGTLIFVGGQHVALTIPAALIMGLPGTLLLILVQATLSDHHGARRAIPLTESNVLASVSAGLAPLAVGSLERIGAGWRGALVLGAIGWGTLAAIYQQEPITQAAARDSALDPGSPEGPLPRTFWTYWLVVFLGVSVEWCLVFWGADFLENQAGLSRVNASTFMSVFFLAMVIGRAAGSRLARTFSLSALLPGALGVALAGFVPFWLAPVPALNLAGLFVAGLGIANLFPLTLSAASGAVAPHQADAASSRIVLAAGLAILITPQILGALADQTGIRPAYGVAGLFLILAAGAIAVANRLAGEKSHDRQA